MKALKIGDMQVLGRNLPPVRLLCALYVIAENLHDTFNRAPGIRPNASRESCILSSLAVRSFLVAIGIPARVVSVTTVIKACAGDRLLHSLGIGVPSDERKIDNRWKGHLVVVAGNWLIDTTLFLCRRDAWRGHLSGMMAVEIYPEMLNSIPMFEGLVPLAGAGLEEDDYTFGIVWFDNPSNQTWREANDARKKFRREFVVRALFEAMTEAMRR